MIKSRDFKTKVNTDLVGKVVNLASRSAKFVAETGLSENYPNDEGLFKEASDESDAIAKDYENGDFSHAMRRILISQTKPIHSLRRVPLGIKKDPEKKKSYRMFARSR